MSDIENNNRTAKLSFKEKLGYGLGDAGFNFYWAIIGSYLIFFYTDIFGITAAAAATMVTITKIVDAFTDPAMGAIADRTNTRWGKFRPYLLFGALPMMGAGIMTMTTPDLDDTGKLVWAYVTYGILMLAYTVLNTPFNSLSGVLTANTQERNSINSIRFFFAYFSSIIVGAATPEIAEYFGNGDRYSAYGWQMTMVIYAVIASILFCVTFFTTKERVKPPANQQKTHPLNDFKDLLFCKPWLVLFVLALVFMTTTTLRGGSSAYYFRYFVERIDLLGSYVGIQFLGLMLGAMSVSTVARYIDKRRLLMIMLAIVCLLSIVFTFIPKPPTLGVIATNETKEKTLAADDLLNSSHNEGDRYQWFKYEKIFWIIKDKVALTESGPQLDISSLSNETISVVRISPNGTTLASDTIPKEIIWMFILNFVISVALGFKPPITWAMYADVADYNEWRTGRRATGMTFSATTFSQKLGSAVGSALILSVLAAMGYQAGQIQSGSSLTGIVYMQTLVPGIFAFITACTLFFYNIDANTLEKIQKDLEERERSNQSLT